MSVRGGLRFFVLAAVTLVPFSTALPARPNPVPVAAARAQRELLVVNRGNRPIFEIRIGHEVGETWSADLLGFASVIDVSSGKEIPLGIGPTPCVFDVLATYQGGHQEVLRGVDLCSTTRVDFTY